MATFTPNILFNNVAVMPFNLLPQFLYKKYRIFVGLPI